MAALYVSPFFILHTYSSCAAVALTYQTKRDFRKCSSGEFQWLIRNNLLDSACAHMQVLRRNLSDADVAEIAGGYTHRRAFKLGDQSAYKTAKNRGILDAVCAHMVTKKRRLSDADISAIASKYSARGEFATGDNGAYQAATKRGILDVVCAHMPAGDRRLSDAEIIAIAGQYKLRGIFKESDFGAYTTMLRRGLEQKACAHMDAGNNGFREDLPAIMYQFKLTLPGSIEIYKVGITNRPANIRLRSMGLMKGVKASLVATISFSSGRDARMTEKRLHQKFADKKYVGVPVMKNGNTELFLSPVIIS